MKIRCFFIAILAINSSIAQNDYNTDSLNFAIKTLSKKEQLQQILEIPYDKFVSNISTSEVLAKQAISFAIELNDSSALARAYLQMAQVYTYRDKRDKKVVYNLKAIKIYEELEEFGKAGYAYGELGYSLKQENLNRALHYMRKGIDLFKKTPNINDADATYDNYGILQGMLKNYDSAIYYHNSSLLLNKKNGDSVGISFAYVHLATVHINLRNFDIAKKYIDSSHTIRLKRNDSYGIIDDFVYYGDLYFAEKKYPKAIENFKIGYDLSIKSNIFFLQKYCADYLTKSYLKLNDYKNAFSFNSIYQKLKDSTLNIQTNSRVAELQIEFETEKKEKEIALQKEQLLKNELELKNKNLYTLLLSAGLLILGVLSIGLFKLQQYKRLEYNNQLTLKEAQTQNKLQGQRLQISRDLHDNIGSRLTFIISSIDNLKFITNKSNENLRAKLSEVNEFSRTTITQLRDTIWAMNKNEIGIEDFKGRLLSFIDKAKAATSNIHFDLNSKVKTNMTFSSIQGINIFRIIQEAINNSLKYAQASKISVDINETINELIIEVKDDGIGFDLNTISLGNGLENMQKRVDEIDAKIAIKSEINKGTAISITCIKNKTNVV